MRFWLSLPFIGRTRLGISVSDRELRKVFHAAAFAEPTPEELAKIDAQARAFARRWTKPVTRVIVIIIEATVVLAVCAALWWLASLVAAHAEAGCVSPMEQILGTGKGAVDCVLKHGAAYKRGKWSGFPRVCSGWLHYAYPKAPMRPAGSF
jgi:hypothetical protein